MLLLIIYCNDISYGISPWLSYFVVFYCKLTMNFSYIFIVVIVDPCFAREHDLVTHTCKQWRLLGWETLIGLPAGSPYTRIHHINFCSLSSVTHFSLNLSPSSFLQKANNTKISNGRQQMPHILIFVSYQNLTFHTYLFFSFCFSLSLNNRLIIITPCLLPHK